MSLYYYLDVNLELQEEKNINITPLTLRQYISAALGSLFGESGSCIQVDILKYNHQEGNAILRCLVTHYVKLRAALTLYGCSKDNILCAIHVNKVSPLLINLVSNSRKYIH